MPNYVEEGSRVVNIRKIALDQEFMSLGHRFTKSTKNSVMLLIIRMDGV